MLILLVDVHVKHIRNVKLNLSMIFFNINVTTDVLDGRKREQRYVWITRQ